MAGAALELSQWQQHGGTVLQSTASNGRIRRTFVSPSGEKFRTWKECLKYMGAMSTTKSTDTEEPDNKKKRPSPPQQETTPKSASENGHAEQDSANENNTGENTSEKKRKTHKQRKAPKTATSNGSGKRSREPCSDDEEDSASRNPKVLIVEEGEEEEELETEPSRRMPKRAAACTSFKEKRVALNEKDSVIEVKQDKVVEGEEVAIVLSAEPGEAQSPQRRILDFIVHDEEGKSQPIELLDVIPLYLTAVVLPTNGILDRERGFRCEGFGPLHSWSITGYEEGRPIVWLCTDMAEYICVKPSGAYKKHYDMLFEKAIVCVEVYRALSKPDGGDPNLGLDDLIARVSRNLLSTKQSFGGQCLGRDYIVSQGTFIVNQLTALDEEASKGEQLFSGLPALVALDNENKKRDVALRSAAQQAPLAKSVGIRIGENVSAEGASSACSKEEDAVDEDEKLARLLQEQEDRKAYSRQNRRPQAGKGKFYIKINEDEIANDYPLPAFYKAQEEEMDEYVLFDDDTSVLAPEDLPRRMLHDWSLYNSDSRLMPLELLPMLAGTETDVEIFGSGIMTEDDGSGYCLSEISNCKSSDIAPAGPNSDGKSVCSGSDGSVKEGGPQGIRIYLSSIKEWMIEFGASMIFISIRTDGAWYRLGNPSPQYAKWYLPVLKTAKLAIRIITMLKHETRASKLSFSDVIKRLVDQQKDEDTFISSKIPEIERYVVVHGQIILQQFAEYPDESIKRSAFVTGLTFKMEQKHHVKLLTSKKKVLIKKGKNMNPRASFRPDGTKPKPMRATTTKLVHRIWSEYYSKFKPEVEEPEQTAVGNGDIDVDEQDEAFEESDEEEETVFVLGQKKGMSLTLKSNQSKSQYKEVKWMGKSSGTTDANEPLYMKAVVRSEEISVGGVVLLDLQELSDGADLPSMLLIEYLYEKDGSQWFHGRVLERGFQTVLGNAADAQEVFLTERCADADLADIKTTVVVQIRNRTWGHTHRMVNAAEDDAYRAQAIEKEKKGLAMEYFCRALYCPEQGAYFKLPHSSLALGTGKCMACKMRDEAKEKEALHLFPDEDGFKFHGMEYHLKDFLYLMPDTFPPLKEEDQVVEKFKASRNRGLKSFAICQLLDIKRTSGFKKITPTSIQLVVRRFFRPDDIGPLKAYVADVREVYYSEETATVGLGAVMGKCEVQKQHQIQDISAHATFNNVFFCSCIFDPQKGTVKQLPANIKLSPSWHYEMEKGKSPATELANAKRKGKAVETEIMLEEPSSPNTTGYLATLDIFAGCGGLSEGLHQSGVSHTKWAIEYEQAAAEAFKLNHQDAEVFCENCNVILRCAMEKGGDLDDCLSTSEADALSEKLDNEAKSKLPVPGEVDFISGGPPCQGFSGMNRFNQRTWSKVQCEMILSFLSFADYFRPRFFLLENVRNFVSFNKGQTFRLTLASLLEMGYQVRFGVLQAGNYGVSQSRKRAFIWAASPEDLLPEWPEPRHVFASSQLKIVLPGGLQYAAVRDAAEGAPLRSITVQDAIGDLPPVGNGADKLEIAYGESPQSWFQKNIRGKENTLYDHISKEMNELNYIRCQRIPKRPGADWRDLPEEKVKLSTGQLVDLIPWCLPNTAERHNQWKGLFGRLDWDGNFPTSVTDPQPMGKVGMCFHPEQDRIVTVRECARSQGFPDGYKFSGNIQSKHRQIGNAVPPPLARALGEKLKEVIDAKKVVI